MNYWEGGEKYDPWDVFGYWINGLVADRGPAWMPTLEESQAVLDALQSAQDAIRKRAPKVTAEFGWQQS